MKYKGVVISDLHFGAMDNVEFKKELSEIFLFHIMNMKKLDFLIIDGDYFDHKIYLNERTSDYAISFMAKLVDICKEFHCPIRCVYGTESHEVNQYNVFSIYEMDPEIDFKVVYMAEEEELLKDLHVLYLPEEQLLDKDEYYHHFFQKKNHYDYIFGHGVIQEIMTDVLKHVKPTKEKKYKKVPYFTCGELMYCCKGQVFFGHYHIPSSFEDKVFYVGSYSRWKHGEEDPKGFYELSCDTDKESYKQTFIENSLAPKYVKFTYGYKDKAMNSDNDLIEELEKKDKLVKAKGIDYVMYVFNIPENHPNPESIITILNERYRFNKSTKVQVVNGYIEKKKKINKEKLNETIQKYPVVFDKNSKMEEKIVFFIKVKNDKDIELDVVKKHLYEEYKV